MPSGNKPVSIGDWVITYLILCVPLVNIVMLFVWAFGSGTNPSKANWAKASLIWFAVAFVLYFMMAGAFIAAMG